MYQYDPKTEVQLARLRQERLDSQLALLRLVADGGPAEPSLPQRLINRVESYFAHRNTKEPTARAA